MVSRHKPTKAAREATHPASDEDYAKLVEAVTRVIILKERDVILKLVYFVDFGDGFPKGVLIKKDDKYNYYRAKAFKLADYLHKIGKMPADAKAVVLATRQITYKIADINKMLEGNVKVCDNDVSGESGDKEGKNGTNGIRDADSSDDQS